VPEVQQHESRTAMGCLLRRDLEEELARSVTGQPKQQALLFQRREIALRRSDGSCDAQILCPSCSAQASSSATG